MVATMLSDPGQIVAVRHAIIETIHVSKGSPIAHAIGEAIKNGLWGPSALVATIPYGLGYLLLVVNRSGKSKLSTEMNVAIDATVWPSEKCHGFGDPMIKDAVGDHYHRGKLGPITMATIVMPNELLTSKAAG